MIQAIFTEGVDEITVHGLTQWDRGQLFQVTYPDIPTLYQVHFTYKGAKEALSVLVADAEETNIVEIPDILLQQPRDLIAYVYLIGSDGSGETVKTVNLPLERRAKPEDYTADVPPTDLEKIESMIKSIQELSDEAVDTANTANNTSNAANETSQNALRTAASAVQTANGAVQTAEGAEEIAGNAVSIANGAVQTAGNAVNIANEAVAVANAIDAKAEQAVADAEEAKDAALNGPFKIGDVRATNRTDLGDSWLLCNGDGFEAEEYPDLKTGKTESASYSPFDTMDIRDGSQVGYGGGVYYLINDVEAGNRNGICYSKYGVHWNKIQRPDGGYYSGQAIAHCGNYWICVCSGGVSFKVYKADSLEGPWETIATEISTQESYSSTRLLLDYHNGFWFLRLFTDSTSRFFYSKLGNESVWTSFENRTNNTSFACPNVIKYDDKIAFWGYSSGVREFDLSGSAPVRIRDLWPGVSNYTIFSVAYCNSRYIIASSNQSAGYTYFHTYPGNSTSTSHASAYNTSLGGGAKLFVADGKLYALIAKWNSSTGWTNKRVYATVDPTSNNWVATDIWQDLMANIKGLDYYFGAIQNGDIGGIICENNNSASGTACTRSLILYSENLNLLPSLSGDGVYYYIKGKEEA